MSVHVLISNQPCFVKVTAVPQSDKSLWLLRKPSITFWLSQSQEADYRSKLFSTHTGFPGLTQPCHV